MLAARISRPILADDAEVALADAVVDGLAEQRRDDEGEDGVEDDADVRAGRQVPVGTQEGEQTEKRSQHPAFGVVSGVPYRGPLTDRRTWASVP